MSTRRILVADPIAERGIELLQEAEGIDVDVKLGLSEEASLGTISDRMDEMRRDFDWLVSDRMIEQAVDMARLGQGHDSIAQTTGVSGAELDAIRKLRRH